MSAVEKLFANLPKLPSMPKVVQELIASLCKDDVDIASLVEQVKQDQSLSARVLAMANSSVYGVSQKIGAIDRAVTLIGLSALRSLVIASGVSRAFNKIEGVDMKKFWRHSMVSAGVARVIGKREGINPEFAYTAGLMHRSGQLVIHLAFPAAAKQLERNQAPEGLEMLKIERSLTETDHCEVGAGLARRWNFPQEIIDALRGYVEPMNSGSALAAVTNLSSRIAEGLLDGESPEAIADSLDPKVMARLMIERADVLWRIESCKELAEQSDQLV